MRLLLLLAVGATAFAQPDTGTITINASRNVTVAPDQLRYSVTLRTDGPAPISDVVARLAGTGITAGDLSYVSSNGPLIEWTFDLVTPFSKMAELNAILVRLQQQTEQWFQSPGLTFRVTTQETSTDAAAQACPLPALVSDARKEADRIASAAGVHVGAITGLSQVPATPAYAQAIFGSSLSIYDPLTGIPSNRLGGTLSLSRILVQYQPLPTYTEACSLVVQFGLVP